MAVMIMPHPSARKQLMENTIPSMIQRKMRRLIVAMGLRIMSLLMRMMLMAMAALVSGVERRQV